MSLIKLESLLFFRATSSKLLLVLYSLLSLLAISAAYLQLQTSASEQKNVEHYFSEQHQHWQQTLETSSNPVNDAGYAAYYSFIPTHQSQSAWSALFPGQHPGFNTNMRIRLLALQGQMNDAPLNNLYHAVFSTLSLDFIWLYLLPLLIGMLSVNLLADDKENNRWSLITATARSAKQLLFIRLAARFVTLYSLNLLLLALACLLLGINELLTIVMVAGLLLLYQLIWFALSLLIIQRQRDRRHNLVQYTALWILLLFLLPGSLYLSRLDSSELTLGIETIVKQRETINNSWDRDKQADFDRYLQQHPQWLETSKLPEGFHWKWYYAMQQHSDEVVEKSVEDYRSLSLKHHQTAQQWGWISPATSLQLALWRISDSDALGQQQYRDQISTYHQSLQQFYWPFLFFDQRLMTSADLQQMPRFEYRASPTTTAVSQAASSLSVMLLVLLLALRRWWTVN